MKSLFSKMVATYTVIIAMSFVIVATIISFWFQNYYLQSRSEQLKGEADNLKQYVVEYANSDMIQKNNDDSSISSSQKVIEKINDSIKLYGSYSKSDIWITDSLGFLYACSNAKYDKLKDTQVFYKDLDKLRSGKIVQNTAAFQKWFSSPVRTYEVPVFDSRNFLMGIVIMITPLNEFDAALDRVYAIIWVSAIFAIIVSCIASYYFSQKIIIKPLAEINYVADKIAKGEVERRVSLKSDDEIGELVKSFNLMADSIEKIEANRRNFVSNVSHEIRSPITSIKGFIGGILDGIIPKEKQNYYLSITYEEIQRLTRLVNDLLDLSAIEAGKIELKNEKFDINEVIRICVIKFETKIKSKSLKVDVCFSVEKLFVEGDKDRITQVVTNLLDNAIKYVGVGGNINVTSRIKGDKVQVSIFNNGECISDEDLPHIWDRFYKADKSRTSKNSTGLGLPIVRNILTQHGEDIWIENVKKEGVTFIFTLKPSI